MLMPYRNIKLFRLVSVPRSFVDDQPANTHSCHGLYSCLKQVEKKEGSRNEETEYCWEIRNKRWK
jgi:hypothetical protein